MLNPIFLDCQSNPNPLQIYDWQSKSKSTFQNGLTIQSKSNHNPMKVYFLSIFVYNLIFWNCKFPRDHSLDNPKQPPNFLTLSRKIGLASKLDLIVICLIRNTNSDFFGFGLKRHCWIANPNQKSNFEIGLSITIQSNKMDCNPDWTIQQSNPAIPWVWHTFGVKW